jgi:hypothetical protein
VELQVFQSLWAMERLPMNAAREWSRAEQIARIAEAGFQGVGVEFLPDAPEQECALALEHGLRIIALCFPQSVADLEPVLAGVDRIGREHVDHVDLQPNVRPFTVAECLPYVHGWQELAAAAGIELYVETHRDRMTTDLLFTLQLLDAVPSLRVTADLSHFVVGREFEWPVDEVNHGLIHRILDRASAYHGRVASREQVQLQVSFPHHRPWVDLFASWWEEGFRRFRATAAPDAALTFMTELGPPEWYAMTGPSGEELSDRWAEALQLRELAEAIWARLEAEERANGR